MGRREAEDAHHRVSDVLLHLPAVRPQCARRNLEVARLDIPQHLGSRRSPSAVEPTRSQKTIEISARRARGCASPSASPHWEQKRASSAPRLPHDGQVRSRVTGSSIGRRRLRGPSSPAHRVRRRMPPGYPQRQEGYRSAVKLRPAGVVAIARDEGPPGRPPDPAREPLPLGLMLVPLRGLVLVTVRLDVIGGLVLLRCASTSSAGSCSLRPARLVILSWAQQRASRRAWCSSWIGRLLPGRWRHRVSSRRVQSAVWSQPYTDARPGAEHAGAWRSPRPRRQRSSRARSRPTRTRRPAARRGSRPSPRSPWPCAEHRE